MKSRRRMDLQLNNQGAAIVSVIVVTAFITIIATVMLYISSMNYQMKQTDYKNTQSFYEAEEALDKLKAALVEDVEDAYVKAYQDVSVQFARLNANQRQSVYSQTYVDELTQVWNERYDAQLAASDTTDMEIDQTMTNAVRKFMEQNGVEEELRQRIVVKKYAGGKPFCIGTENKQFSLKGIMAVYTNSSGYTTYISTDIGLLLPEYDVATQGYEAWDESHAESETDIVRLSDYVVYMNWKKE